VKCKARWVAQGFAQKYGIDYHETFTPVARFDSIRALLARVAHHDWELHQMDVKSAYLNGDLEEELYMKQLPTGFVIPGTEGMVCGLNESLYGLKQAGRTWNKRIDVELKAHGFAPIDADPCVYAYKCGSVVLIISLYVDDLLLASDSLDELNKVKAELQTCFDMEDMGEPATTTTGLDTIAKTRYQSAVGALMYAARATRPDISFAVTALSHFCQGPTEQHWQAVKRVSAICRQWPHLQRDRFA
jgi:hypothetical protein